MKIADYSIKHPATVIILSIAVILFGIYSVSTMNQEFVADITMPQVIIVTLYSGVGAETIESEVTAVLEDHLSVLTGVRGITSTSSESASVVSLEFAPDVDLNARLSEIREKINGAIPDLPEEIEGEPSLLIAGSSLLPIMSFAVKSDRDPEVVTDYVQNEIIPSVSRLPGVSQVSLHGGTERELSIKLHLDEMAEKNIAVMDVFNLLRYTNVSLPAGSADFRGSSLNIRTTGTFSTIQEIENLVVGFNQASSTFIHLADVADVSISDKEVRAYISANGEPLITVDIAKRGDGNTVEITDAIREYLSMLEEDKQGLLEFIILTDDSETVKNSLNAVLRNGIVGILMAVLVILFFLHDIRATLIIASSLPLSIVFALGGMKLAGQTINILSMAGITVALGMIVDSSIVVLESIDRVRSDSGDAGQAASKGTNLVSGAIIASTTTSISVFAPLIVLTGIIGIIMRDISLTLVFCLLASLIVSVVIIPFLASRLYRGIDGSRIRKKGIIGRSIDKGMNAVQRGYRILLRKALENRGFVVILAVSVLVITVAFFSSLGMSFVPRSDSGEFYIYIKTPSSYTMESTHAKVAAIEELTRERVPELASGVFFTGFSNDTSRLTTSRNRGYGVVTLVDTSARARSIHEIILDLQVSIETTIPDVQVSVEAGGIDKLLNMTAGGSGFKIKLSGTDFDLLQTVAEDFRQVLENDPEILKAELDLDFNQQEIVTDLLLDQMGNLGINSYEAAVTARTIFNGMDVGYFKDRKTNYPILLTSDIAGEKISEDTFNRLSVKSQGGKIISFSNFADLVIRPAVSVLKRENRMNTIVVTGFTTKEDFTGVQERVMSRIEALDVPFGIFYSIGGTSGLFLDSMDELLMILSAALFLVYMVMVIQFQRFKQPLIVMVSIPFCIIGVVGGLLIFGSTISLIAFLGIIALAGIVVNNAIMLIDYINIMRREQGQSLMQAIIEGGSTRIKPILMTTLTTMLGVMPMALSKGNGTEIYAPLGQAIAGGLISSTLITLVLIPVLYYIIEHKEEERRTEG